MNQIAKSKVVSKSGVKIQKLRNKLISLKFIANALKIKTYKNPKPKFEALVSARNRLKKPNFYSHSMVAGGFEEMS